MARSEAAIRAVWKFPFAVGANIIIKMPPGSEIVHMECQIEQPCLWAIVDLNRTEENPEFRVFGVFGTGHVISDPSLEYVGTFLTLGGAFVGHVFEQKEEESDVKE